MVFSRSTEPQKVRVEWSTPEVNFSPKPSDSRCASSLAPRRGEGLRVRGGLSSVDARSVLVHACPLTPALSPIGGEGDQRVASHAGHSAPASFASVLSGLILLPCEARRFQRGSVCSRLAFGGSAAGHFAAKRVASVPTGLNLRPFGLHRFRRAVNARRLTRVGSDGAHSRSQRARVGMDASCKKLQWNGLQLRPGGPAELSRGHRPRSGHPVSLRPEGAVEGAAKFRCPFRARAFWARVPGALPAAKLPCPFGTDRRGPEQKNFEPGRRAGFFAANHHTTKVQTGGKYYGSQ